MLTATPRLARHLGSHHRRERLRQGANAWPTPDILDLNAWLARAWEHSLIRGGPAGRNHLLSPAQFRHAVDRVADGIDTPDPVNGSAGARSLLGRSWNLARDWDIATSDLAATASNADTRYAAEWASRFATLCREREWVDAASLAAVLLPELADSRVPVARPVLLAGFSRPTPSQRRLFACLDDLGLLAGRLASTTGDYRDAVRVELDEPGQERRWAARWARARLEAQPDALIGIIVPDLDRQATELRRSFLDAFDPLWRDRDGTLFPVSLDDGTRLADAGLVHTALLLLRVPDGYLDFREVGQLLRSPYLAGSDQESATRARLDLRIRDGRMQRIDLHSLCRRFAAEGEPAPRRFLDALGTMLEISEQNRGRREPAAWLPLIDALLKEAGFCRGRELAHDEERVRDGWSRLLEQFGALGEVVGDITFREARRLLTEAARDQKLRSTASDSGVHIMTPWDADSHAFDAVWLSGMTSEAWPPVARPSPLIAMSLQRERGVPESLPDVYREQALAVVASLTRGTPSCVASWATHNGEEERVPAPQIEVLQRVEIDTLGIEPDGLDYRHIILAGPRAVATEDPPPPVAADERVRGGSRLANLQSACPARAFFELRLGAQEMRSPPYGLDARTRGNLVHDAAEALYRSLRDVGGPARTSAVALDEFIAQAIDKAVERHVPKQHPLADTLRTNERRRVNRLLRMLVAHDRERGEFDTVELEETHVATIDDLPLNLRFDRVDEAPDGKRLVIDYKTGAHFGINACLGERPLQLQLPLYAVYGSAAAVALFWLQPDRLRIDGIGMANFGVTASGKSSRTFPVKGADEWQAQIEAWRRVIEQLVTEFRAGDCRIDLRQDQMAGGQFAMLTRRWEIDSAPDSGGDE